MKAKKILYLLPLLLIAAVALFFSCESLGAVTQIGASIAQATGLVSPGVADAIAKSGVAWSKTFEQITPEQEYYIGRAVAANVLSAYKIQTSNPGLTDYANKICNALVINSPRSEIFNGYHVNILDSDEINAFATPGGHIFITNGLINCTTSEDELAGVIAHEVSHIQLEHGLKAIKNSRINQALAVTATSAGSAATGVDLEELTSTFGLSINEIVVTMMTNGYSRSQEYDADSTAMVLMSLAGYEPSSLISMLRVLDRNQSGHPGGFNSTHPTPALRITNAEKSVGKFSVEDTRSYRMGRFASVI